jgi:hypothetical protein
MCCHKTTVEAPVPFLVGETPSRGAWQPVFGFISLVSIEAQVVTSIHIVTSA